jgi:micrococcal nuclease
MEPPRPPMDPPRPPMEPPRPYTYRVTEVVAVTDGDTVDVRLDLGFDISVRKRVRLAGIDAPESRTTDHAEKALGLEAKEWLQAVVRDTTLVICTDKPDSTEKYGRVLGHLYVAGQAESVNDRMVREGYAVPYSGQGPKNKDLEALVAKRKTLALVPESETAGRKKTRARTHGKTT